MRGKGIPNVNTKRRGDVIFTVAVETPTGLSQEQKELLRKFGDSLGENNAKKKKSFFSKLFNK